MSASLPTLPRVDGQFLSFDAVYESQPATWLCRYASVVLFCLHDLNIIDTKVGEPEQRQG